MTTRLRKVAGPVFTFLIAVVMWSSGPASFAQQAQPKSFPSPEQASEALYEAVRSDNAGAVQAILGATPQLISSGKEDEDKLERQHFVEKYQEMHRLVREPEGFTALYVGAENWPFPIPLVLASDGWHFDSGSGAQEIQARQIGEDETLAIQVCEALGKTSATNVDKAQADDAAAEFAQAVAKSQNTAKSATEFHGYYFREMRSQAGGNMVVAYPANYGASGVMTFVVSGGAVYEKDLGPKTTVVAEKIKGNSVENWNRVQ